MNKSDLDEGLPELTNAEAFSSAFVDILAMENISEDSFQQSTAYLSNDQLKQLEDSKEEQ